MNSLSVLRLRLRQPSAHYRVPFTFSRRHTYPIPPFSTVIGLLCNILGIRNQNGEDFENLKKLHMAIYGRYESLTREYVWFRNLSAERHLQRFGTATNRFLDGVPEHPGGQTPVRIDVLENVELLIYLGHQEEKFLKKVKEAFHNPSGWLYPLHLGRAEDLVIIEELEMVEAKEEASISVLPYFAWIPKDPSFIWNPPEDYEDFFKNIYATYHRVPTFYQLRDGVRNFDFVRAKLFEKGGFPLKPTAEPYDFPGDEVDGKKIPLILTKIGGKDGNMGKE